MARAKELSPKVPYRTIDVPATKNPAVPSPSLIDVSNFKGLTAILFGAECAGEITKNVEINTKDKNRFTQVPASDRARLSWLWQLSSISDPCQKMPLPQLLYHLDL